MRPLLGTNAKNGNRSTAVDADRKSAAAAGHMRRSSAAADSGGDSAVPLEGDS